VESPLEETAEDLVKEGPETEILTKKRKKYAKHKKGKGYGKT